MDSYQKTQKQVFFIGSQFDNPITGGHLYNAKVVKSFQKSGKFQFHAIDYPWLSFLGNLLFDFNTAKSIFKSRKNAIVIFDESLHQRMFLTLLVSLFVKKIKTILMLHQLAYTRRENKLHYLITKKVDQFMIKYCDLAISAGICVKELAEELAGSKHLHKIKTVLTTLQSEVQFNSNKQKYKLLFVGSVVPAKGVKYLVEAVDGLPEEIKSNVTVEIAGSMNDKEFLRSVQQLIETKGLQEKFSFRGLLKFDELSKAYHQGELFVFPSLSENMPMAVLESMVAGCIPVVFNNSAMPYLIKNNQSGFIVENLNSQALTEAIVSYYAMNNEEQLKMRELAHKTASQYAKTWDELGQEFIAVVSSVA